jgi:hypothetical protein
VQFDDPCIDGKRRKRSPRDEKTKIKNEEEGNFIFSLSILMATLGCMALPSCTPSRLSLC